MSAVQEKESERLRAVIRDLTAQIAALTASGRVNAGRLYGRKSEKSVRLNRRRDDDDRNQRRDNFDGTAGSDKGSGTGSNAGASQDKTSSGDTVSALQKKILRTHPGSEMHIERVDYSKAAAYTDSPVYHRLEDYYECRKEHTS